MSPKASNTTEMKKLIFKDISEGEWHENELGKLRIIEGIDADKTLLFNYAEVCCLLSLVFTTNML